jgi:DNA replication initiation complex subunit (GINS family)
VDLLLAGAVATTTPQATARGDEGVSYEMLQDLLRSERRSNRPTPLAPRFWTDARAFIDGITQEFRAAQAKDPFDLSLMRLIDRVKNARATAEGLWTVRERKLAQGALARDGKRPEGLTPEEVEVWNGLRKALDEGRMAILQQAGVPAAAFAPLAPVPLAQPEPAAASPALRARAPPPAAAEPAPTPVAVPADTAAAAHAGLVTIRALGDIPPFVGPDMQTYLLKEGDLASVPPSIAKLLEKRKKAAIVAEK